MPPGPPRWPQPGTDPPLVRQRQRHGRRHQRLARHRDRLAELQPNVPAYRLAYDSIAANPEPIIIVENTIAGDGAQPGKRPVDVQRRHAAHDLLLQHARVSIRATCNRSPFRRPTRRRLRPVVTLLVPVIDIGSACRP